MKVKNFNPFESLSIISQHLKLLRDNDIIRSKNLVGDLGEFYACRILRFERTKNLIEHGYDAIDSGQLKVQVKTRLNPQNVNKIIFSSFSFDYCVFVEIDELFIPKFIRKIDKNLLRTILDTRGDRLSVSKFRKNSDIVWTHDGNVNSLQNLLFKIT